MCSGDNGTMAESLSLLATDTEVPCPVCGYPVWVLLAEVVTQAFVRCPCCRGLIHLLDADGSVQNLDQTVKQMLKELFS